MPHHDEFQALPTPLAARYAGVSLSTLHKYLTPVARRSNGRVGRPTSYWSVDDLDRLRGTVQRHKARFKRQGGEA